MHGNANGYRNSLALYAGRDECSVTQMLASPDAAAYGTLSPHDLGEQALWIAAMSQVMTMTTMVAEDEVALSERGQGYRDVLLSDAGVRRAAQLTLGEHLQQHFFEPACKDEELQIGVGYIHCDIGSSGIR
jgi:hypothetical protein